MPQINSLGSLAPQPQWQLYSIPIIGAAEILISQSGTNLNFENRALLGLVLSTESGLIYQRPFRRLYGSYEKYSFRFELPDWAIRERNLIWRLGVKLKLPSQTGDWVITADELY